MLREVRSATMFLRDLLGRRGTVPSEQLDGFTKRLEQSLLTKYDNHWHPQKPYRGSGYRCIRLTQSQVDPLILMAAEESGVSDEDLSQSLPTELTLWIDPSEVAYRIGEDGSICHLLDSFTDAAEPKSCISSSTPSPKLARNCKANIPLGSSFNSTRGTLVTECLSS